MRRLFHIKYGFQKGSHKIKNNYKNKKYTIHKDIKNLKYVKSIEMYKMLTQIHLPWINLNQWAAVAAFKPLSWGLTKIWIKMSS